MTTDEAPARRTVRCPVCWNPLEVDAHLPEAEVQRRLAFLARLVHGPALAAEAGVDANVQPMKSF